MSEREGKEDIPMDSNKPMSRREFLVTGTSLLASLGIGGSLLFSPAGNRVYGEQSNTDSAQNKSVESPILVVIQLSGGNDGLNTLIPYTQGAYFDARPTLKLTQQDVLAIDNQVGLHPSLTGLKELYDRGKLAIVQGVGYPKPDRSHFRSMEIWQTAEPEKWIRSGWLGRYGESTRTKADTPIKLLQIGNSANKAFRSDTINVPVIQSMETFNFFDPKTPKTDQNRIARTFLDMYDPKRQGLHLKVTCEHGRDAYNSVEAIQSLSGNYQNKVEYPKTNFAKDLQLVAKMLAGKSGTRVFYLQLGGFDDHAQEKDLHAKLLKDMDDAIASFYKDLEVQGYQDRVVTLAFSEFGRRVKENGSGGTDHGAAGPVLVLGGQVKGGMYGLYPSLSNLDNGDLKYEVDFRSIYYTLVENWMKGDAKGVLGKTYEKLKFI